MVFLRTQCFLAFTITLVKFARMWNLVDRKRRTSSWGETWLSTSVVVSKWCLVGDCIVSIRDTFTIVCFLVWCIDFLQSIWVCGNIGFVITSSNRDFSWILKIMTLVHMDVEDKVDNCWSSIYLLDVRPIWKLFILDRDQQWSTLLDGWSIGITSETPDIILLVSCRLSSWVSTVVMITKSFILFGVESTGYILPIQTRFTRDSFSLTTSVFQTILEFMWFSIVHSFIAIMIAKSFLDVVRFRCMLARCVSWDRIMREWAIWNWYWEIWNDQCLFCSLWSFIESINNPSIVSDRKNSCLVTSIDSNCGWEKLGMGLTVDTITLSMNL